MSAFLIHCESLRRHYFVDVLSKAFFFVAFTWAFQLLFPLFLCSESAGFWKLRSTYHERPAVKYTGKLLVIADVDNEKNERDFLVYSSFEQFSEAFDPFLRIPFIQSSEEDVNLDGRPDHLKLDLRLPLQQNERVRELSVLLVFSYSIQEKVRLEMDALALVQTGLLSVRRLRTPPSHYEIKTSGYLETQQWEPLPHAGSLHPPAFKIERLLAKSAEDNFVSFNLVDFMATYLSHNLTTRFTPLHSSYDARHSSTDVERRVTASINVKYPVDVPFEYWAGFFEVFKWAWVQYLAAFYPVYLFLNWLRSVLFKNKVFAQVVVDDVQISEKKAANGAFPTVGRG